MLSELLDDPKTHDMVHRFLLDVTDRYLASDGVHRASSDYLRHILSDKELQATSGRALWETMKHAVLPGRK
jgi:hypothetical protein